MRHFIFFLGVAFFAVFLAVTYKSENLREEKKRNVRIYSYSSFVNSWGPGPRLKEMFEKTCQCHIEFVEGSDAGILLQRIKLEGSVMGADLIIGFDQFDINKAAKELSWKELKLDVSHFVPEVQSQIQNKSFIPYDWGVLSIVYNKKNGNAWGASLDKPAQLDDLLNPSLKKQIALEDPRTSSPGLQWISWILTAKGTDAGYEYLEKMMEQAHSFSPSWSTAYGLFTKKQVSMVYSYVTSPIYHKVEEKNNDYDYIRFSEGYVAQYEYMAIPEYCHECTLAEGFVNLMLSPEGQKVIMEKNYMFPVLQGVADGTLFDGYKNLKILTDPQVNDSAAIELRLKKWMELRRSISKK